MTNPKDKSLREILYNSFIYLLDDDKKTEEYIKPIIEEIQAHYKARRLSEEEIGKIINENTIGISGSRLAHAIFTKQEEK